MDPANEILEFPIACIVSISIMNKTKRIKRERFSFPVVWSMIEFFTFLWFAHFQLQEFTRIWMKTWSLNRMLNLARFVDSLLTSYGLSFYPLADPPCFPVFLLTYISTQFLFRESCVDSVNYKHNSYFFPLFFVIFITFSVFARVDHVSLHSSN